jgi:hypothetical protein
MKPSGMNITINRDEKEEERVGWLVKFLTKINPSIRADFKSSKKGDNQKQSTGHFP